MPNRPIDNARKILRKLRNNKIKNVRNPEKYEDLLTEDEFDEMLLLLDYDKKVIEQPEVITRSLRGLLPRLPLGDHSAPSGRPPLRGLPTDEMITLEQIYDIIDNYKNVKDSSKQTDKKNIKGVFNVLGIDDLFDILDSVSHVYDLLDEHYDGGLARVLASLLKLLDFIELDEIFDDFRKDLRDKYIQLRHNNKVLNIAHSPDTQK